MTEPSGYVLEPLRDGADFTLYRGRQHGAPSPVLAVGLATERPRTPQTLASTIFIAAFQILDSEVHSASTSTNFVWDLTKP